MGHALLFMAAVAWSCITMATLESVTCDGCGNNHQAPSLNKTIDGYGVGSRRLLIFLTTAGPTTAAPGTGGPGGTTAAGPTAIDNLEEIDTILTLEELLEVLQGNNVNPRPGNIGEGWNNINFIHLLKHYHTTTPWLYTLWGQVMTGLAGVLFLFWIMILLYSIYACGMKNKVVKRRIPWWYFRPRTPTPTPPPQPVAPPQPQQPQIYFLNVGGGGEPRGTRSPRGERMTSMVPPLPPVYTPAQDEEPVQYHVVHTARGDPY